MSDRVIQDEEAQLIARNILQQHIAGNELRMENIMTPLKKIPTLQEMCLDITCGIEPEYIEPLLKINGLQNTYLNDLIQEWRKRKRGFILKLMGYLDIKYEIDNLKTNSLVGSRKITETGCTTYENLMRTYYAIKWFDKNYMMCYQEELDSVTESINRIRIDCPEIYDKVQKGKRHKLEIINDIN